MHCAVLRSVSALRCTEVCECTALFAFRSSFIVQPYVHLAKLSSHRSAGHQIAFVSASHDCSDNLVVTRRGGLGGGG